MKKLIAQSENKCRFYCQWKLVFDKDGNKYYECPKCKSRKVHIHTNGGPVRFNWLDGKTNRVVSSSKKKLNL
jgi:hypothetical protein